ncbi:hypothetical protein VSR34_16205 [Paraburkholderia sp. JHI2823]|uniref:hypothetical protein n=1 Tax=Paraburkholderia sp. JHI2823 TaxID=3112960 RepID=UPI0031708FDD
MRSLRIAVALDGLLHLFVDLPQSHAARAFEFAWVRSRIAVMIVFHESFPQAHADSEPIVDVADACLGEPHSSTQSQAART